MGKSARKQISDMENITDCPSPQKFIVVAKEINDALIEQQLGDALGTLDMRRSTLLRDRFGFGNKTPASHEELALKIGASVNKVDEEMALALRKLMGYGKKTVK